MSHKYTSQKIQTVIDRYNNGESVTQIVHDTGISRSTIYNWIKKHANQANGKLPTLREYRTLQNKVKRLEDTIEILKKAECTPSDPLDVKLDALESPVRPVQRSYALRGAGRSPRYIL